MSSNPSVIFETEAIEEIKPELLPHFYDGLLGKIIMNVPFLSVHLAALLIFFVGFSWTALGVCLAMYVFRMFALTGFYHRYFSHRSFKTSRFMQFWFAFIGTLCTQNGPLWWAGHHRKHHRYSDQPEDVHSPVQKGFFWSHVGWILSRKFDRTNTDAIKDFAKFPEIRFIDRYDLIGPVLLAIGLFFLGGYLEVHHPHLKTTASQMLIWGFFVSTTLLYHGTFTINSLAHVWGKKRYNNGDESRNNPVLALITLGEGWHNNHHRFMQSERQGFFWWEFDITHYGLTMMSWLGIVWDLRKPPKEVLEGK